MTRIDFEDFFQRACQATGATSQAELAQLLGVDRSAVTQAKRKGAAPEKWALALARAFGLDPEWLVTGRGPIRQAGASEYVAVPRVRALLSAGGGSFETSAEPVGGMALFRRDWLARKGAPERMALMEVLGDSMEPEIKDGDLALVDLSRQDIVPRAIHAVGVGDAILVKRVEARPGALVLLSDNPAYAPLVLLGDEIETARIVGRVVWTCREYA